MEEIVEKINRGARITPDDALVLFNDAPLSLLAMLSTKAKEIKSGKNVFYNKNFHVEPTNICVFNCKFCSYRRPADSPDSWCYTPEQIFDICRNYRDRGVTEVHIVGGVHPSHDLYYYADMISEIQKILPDVSIKAFSAIELDYMIAKAGLSLKDGLQLLKNRGMVTMPGGGAEIFDEQIRKQICGEKSTSEQWLNIHSTAHEIGVQTNATMLYGHIEKIEHRIDHMNRLRKLQDETGGFNAFIPLKYRNMNNSMSEIGETSTVDDMRTLAVSRIFLDNFSHIKAYWPMYGKAVTQMALTFGADDIDGTIDDTTKIYSMAGAEDQKPTMNVSQMRKLIEDAGYIPVERDSFYNAVKIP